MGFNVFEQLLAEELSIQNPSIEEAVESILFDEHHSSFSVIHSFVVFSNQIITVCMMPLENY